MLLAVSTLLGPAGVPPLRPDPPDDPPGKGRDELEDQLRDRYADARARAVKGLARLGERQDWEKVLEALGDREGMVADTAQVALAALDDPRVLSDLLGREGLGARDDEVRERAAEVLGRMAREFEADDLARLVDARDPAACRALLWSCERLARAERVRGDRERLVKRIEGCLSRRLDPGLRGTALMALAALDPPRALAHARGALEDREAQVRGAGLRALLALHAGRGLGDAALERLAVARLADEDGGVRWVAIEVLEALGTRDGLRALAERLGLEERERVRRRLVEALQARTGLRHRRDPRPWLAALEALPADWRAPARAVDGDADEPEARAGATSAASTRLPIRSDHLVFLVDLSGSIWNDRGDGRTRKECLDEVVHATLAALPDGARFDLVPYTGEPRRWNDALVRADRRTRREARRWYDDLRMTGPGDFFAAVELALADPEVDTLCVLTDGAPTGGRRWDLELMIPILLERTRHRPITFDVVLVDATRGMRRRWRELTEPTGGVLQSVDLKLPAGAAPGAGAASGGGGGR